MSNTSYSIFALEQCNEDMITERINMEELFEKKREKDLRKLKTFNQILARIHRHIRIISSQRDNSNCCWYIVPEIILGVPDYNQPECINYIIEKLEENGFVLRYIVPNVLFICWKNYVPKYVRQEIQKKTGMQINCHGEIIQDEEDEEGVSNSTGGNLERFVNSTSSSKRGGRTNAKAEKSSAGRKMSFANQDISMFANTESMSRHQQRKEKDKERRLRVSFEEEAAAEKYPTTKEKENNFVGSGAGGKVSVGEIDFLSKNLNSIDLKKESKHVPKYLQEADPNGISIPNQFNFKYNPFDLHEPAMYHERFSSINTSLMNAQEQQIKQNEFQHSKSSFQELPSSSFSTGGTGNVKDSSSYFSRTQQSNNGHSEEVVENLETIRKKASNASKNFTPIQNYKAIGIGNLFGL